MSKNRKRAEEENRRRMDRHSREKGAATRIANRQQLVALGKEMANGLHPVRLDSIADQLDEVDPKVRGMVVTHHPTPPAFVPPQFQPSLVREKAMSEPTRSQHRSKLLKMRGAAKNGQAQTPSSIQLPRDLANLVPDIEYVLEINDDGLLFRPAHMVNTTRPLPSWAAKK